MFLSKFTRVFGSIKKHKSAARIHSAKQFRMILEHERSRADRNQHQFSLLILDMSNIQSKNGHVKCLMEILTKRIRSVDEAGWMNNHSMGVLLPYTREAGAWKLANDICRMESVKDYPPTCTVYSYPSKDFYDDGNGDGETGQKTFRDIYPQWQKSGSRDVFSVVSSIVDEPESMTGQLDLCLKHQGKVRDEVFGPFLLQPLPLWKRTIDVIGATAAITLFSPIMLFVVIGIKLTSKGPVIFKQKRAGLGGKAFDFYKFRSMIIDAESQKEKLMKYNERIGPVFKMNNDPRITRFGTFIRKWSLDELPQLFNVLKGDLSLVGPRPLVIDEARQHNQWQDRRLCITPGITCLWQIYARDDSSFDRWARLDINYITQRSFWLDLKILFKTLPAVLMHKGAC